MAVSVFMRAEGYDEPRGKEFYNTLRRTVSALPGVESVTLTTDLPLLGSSMIPVQMPGNPKLDRVGHSVVDSAYFATIGLPVLGGRTFDASDRDNGPPVAVINRKMAEMFWPGASALGKTFLAEKPARQITVVGVAANSKYEDIDEATQPFLYYDLNQNYSLSVNVLARTRGDPNHWLATFGKSLRGLGLKVMIDPISFESWINLDLFAERMTAIGVAIFSALALLLAMIGLLGAVSYSVSERKKELGIRVALGARPGQLLAMVLRQTATVAGAGIAIGALFGVVATALLRSQLYRVGAVEWMVLLPVGVAMMALSLVMAYLSARPWLKVDPMEAVRHA
jgi:hypothetical protein